MKYLVLAAAALTLAACGQDHGTCKAPPSAKAAAETFAKPRPVLAGQPGFEQQEARAYSESAKACVQRQAWALAGAKDGTELLADAAVTACDEPLSRAAQLEATGFGEDFQKAYDLDVKAMTRWARAYLVQYRTGACVE